MFKRIPASRPARWQLMKSVIEEWMRPLTTADGFSAEELVGLETKLGHPLSKAVREWYQLAGHAEDIWSTQDRLVLPFIEQDLLVFCFENQGIWNMGVRLSDLDQADPPVFGWMNTSWVGYSEFGQLNATVSECALQCLAWCMKMANRNPQFTCHMPSVSDFYGYGFWEPATLAAIKGHCDRCAFPVWRLWGRDNVFYERPGLLIRVGQDDTGDPQALDVSVRSKKALADYERMVRGTGFQWSAGNNWYTELSASGRQRRRSTPRARRSRASEKKFARPNSATLKLERPDHADAVALIAELESYLEPLSPRESWQDYSVEKLVEQHVAFFVLRDNGKPAGCGGIQLVGKEYGELKALYVRPKFRGRSFGKWLVNHLSDYAQANGVRLLRLEIGIHQTEAIALFEGIGFQRILPSGDHKKDPMSFFYEKRIK